MNFLSDSAGTFGDLTERTYPFADIILALVYERYDGPSIRSAISLERIVGE